MLPLLLMLVALPPAQSPGGPMVVFPAAPPGNNAGPTLTARCPNAQIQAALDQPDTRSPPGLLYRPDGAVRRYLLIERSVGGCSQPISFPLTLDPGEPIPDVRPAPPPTLRLLTIGADAP